VRWSLEIAEQMHEEVVGVQNAGVFVVMLRARIGGVMLGVRAWLWLLLAITVVEYDDLIDAEDRQGPGDLSS
jgi:hypothetical protein